MTWNDITVFQWQQITELITKDSKDLTDLDLSVKMAAIITNQTEHQIDSLPIAKLTPLLKQIEFIHSEMQPKAMRFINVNGRRYKCIYDIRKMPAARYIESKHFSQDVSGNLHRIAASMVIPMKRNWMGWKEDKYDAAKHEEYANDLLTAPVVNVLGSVVFFYQVFRLWTKISKGYLKTEMMKTGMTAYQAEAAYQALCEVMDGFIKPSWLPSMKEYHWKRLMRSLPSNS